MIAIRKPLASLCAADMMSGEVLMIPQEMSVAGAARLLSRAQVSGAPVVDAAGRCIGVLSATDFVHWAENGKPHPPVDCACAAWQILDDRPLPEGSVRDLMTRDPITATPNTTLADLAQRMLLAHIHRVVVVDRLQRPIGIVSSTDILAAVARANESE